MPAAIAPFAAARISSPADIVSIQQTSAPPAFKPFACSVKSATASSSVSAPSGTKSSPVGPIEPATTTGRAAASAIVARNLGGALVDLEDAILRLVQLHAVAVGAKAVGQDDVGAGLDEGPEEGVDRLRVVEVPKLRGIAGREPGGEEIGAGCAVGKEDALLGKKFGKCDHDASIVFRCGAVQHFRAFPQGGIPDAAERASMSHRDR